MMNTLPSAETPDVAELRRLAEAANADAVQGATYERDWPLSSRAVGHFLRALNPDAVLALLDDADALRAEQPIVRTAGDLTARHQLTRPRIRVAGREGALKLVKPSDAHPGTLTLIWGDWWEDVSPEEPCEVLPEGETHE